MPTWTRKVSISEDPSCDMGYIQVRPKPPTRRGSQWAGVIGQTMDAQRTERLGEKLAILEE